MENKTIGTAFFLRNARRLEDLEDYRKDCLQKKKPAQIYIIEKAVELPKIDFENFSTDLFADRQFIEDNQNIMYTDDNGVLHVILVTQTGQPDVGILVNSKKQVYPMYTAVYHKGPRLTLVK